MFGASWANIQNTTIELLVKCIQGRFRIGRSFVNIARTMIRNGLYDHFELRDSTVERDHL